MRKIIASLMVMGVALVAATSANATNDKITICHVAGLASDPANYITLNLPPQAVYGNGGHFNENGTPQAGHEQDSFGACNPPPPPFDQCPNIPGNQPEGFDCNPVPPPHDECENIPGDQPEGFDCTPEPPVEPPVRCEPPNPDGTYGGKDGKPGNDECIADPVPPTTTTTPPSTGTTPPVVTPVPPVVSTPVVKEKIKKKVKKVAAIKKVKGKTKKVAPKPDNPPAKAVASETLPYTGAETWMGMLAGVLLIGGGTLLRRLGA